MRRLSSRRPIPGSDAVALVHAIQVLRGLVGLDAATGTDPGEDPTVILDKLLI